MISSMEMKGILFLSMDIQHKGERLRIDQPMAVDLSKYETVVSLCPFNYYFLRLAFLFFFSSVFSFSFSLASLLYVVHIGLIFLLLMLLFSFRFLHIFFSDQIPPESLGCVNEWLSKWKNKEKLEWTFIAFSIRLSFNHEMLTCSVCFSSFSKKHS